VQQAGLAFAAIDTLADWETFLQTNSRQIVNMMDNLQNISQVNQAEQHAEQRFFDPAQVCREYEILRQLCQANDTVLIARHGSSTAARLAAEALQLPLVAVYLAPTMVIQPSLDETLHGAAQRDELNALRSQLNLPPAHSWQRWVNAAPRSIGLWPDWFAEATAQWPTTLTLVGFPLEGGTAANPHMLPPQVRDWLEQGLQPILISGGTSTMLRTGFYSASAAACQLLGVPALLVTQYRELLPDELPEQIVWGAAFDFEQIMPLMNAVIHHGGIGTLAQAMVAGLPQLVLAHSMDRPDNGARVKRLGCGDVLGFARWQPDQIAQALEPLLAPGVRTHCAALAQRTAASDALGAVADVVEQALHDPTARLNPAAFLEEPAQSGAVDPRPAPDQLANKLADLSPEQLAALMRRMQYRRQPQT